MKLQKAVALLLALLMFPVGALGTSMPETDAINRRIERNTAKTLDHLPQTARARTDSIIVGVSDLMGELNPFWARTTGDDYAVSLLYDELLFVSNNGEVGAGVASYATSPDGLTHTFTIKDRVAYTDGAAVTAEDFINALYLLLMPGYDGAYDISRAGIVGVDAYLNGEAESIAGIQSISDQSFSVTLETAATANLLYLAVPPLRVSLFGSMRRPAALEGFDAYLAFYEEALAGVRAADATGMAFGQYLLDTLEAGSRAVFVKNESYWRGSPVIGTLELLVVEAGEELDAIMSGAVDIISMLGSVAAVDTVADFETSFINLYTWKGDILGYLGMDLENPLFADKAVRQALVHGLDREAARARKVERYGSVPSMLLFDSFSANTAQTAQELNAQFAYDPEKAAALLDEAGWALSEDGLRYRDGEALAFTLVYNTPNPVMETVMPQIVDDYAALGIQVTAEALAFETLLARVDSGDYDMYALARRLPASAGIASSLFMGDSHLNLVDYESDMLQRLLDMADSAEDNARQTVVYEMLYQELFVEMPFIPLYRRSEFLLVNARVMNVTITTSHQLLADAYRFFLTDTLEGQW